MKRTVDRLAKKFSFLPENMSDRLMQVLSAILPNHLPKRMEAYRKKYQFNFVIETNNDGVEEAEKYLTNLFQKADGDFFACDEKEAKRAILQRFVVGGAIGRYHVMNKNKNGDLMTIDVALRRNEKQWFEQLPPEIEEKIAIKFYYGHFLCHVMHQNYIMKKGVDAKAVKKQILAFFDERGAEYPAEHNVGHEYAAKADLKAFYQSKDPTNTFNPGIGQTSKLNFGRGAFFVFAIYI